MLAWEPVDVVDMPGRGTEEDRVEHMPEEVGMVPRHRLWVFHLVSLGVVDGCSSSRVVVGGSSRREAWMEEVQCSLLGLNGTR